MAAQRQLTIGRNVCEPLSGVRLIHHCSSGLVGKAGKWLIGDVSHIGFNSNDPNGHEVTGIVTGHPSG